MKKYLILLFCFITKIHASNYLIPDTDIELEYEVDEESETITITAYSSETGGHVVIPNTIESKSVTKIAEDAFQFANNISQITLPEELTQIEEGAFNYCRNLIQITIPDLVTRINEGTFRACDSLEEVILSNQITRIARNSFYGCESLEQISLPDSLEEIESYAFYGSGLRSIEIPSKVSSILPYAFTCDFISEINVVEENNFYKSLNGVLFNKDLTTLISFPKRKQNIVYTYSIPTTVSKIEEGAFRYCNSIYYITIPENVLEIGASAFSNCGNLNSVTLPEGLTTIKAYAFYYLRNLESINIPNSVTEIGSYAFAYSAMNYINLSNNLTEISDGTFASCENLQSITIPDKVTKIGSRAFSEIKEITIPASVSIIAGDAFGYEIESITVSPTNNELYSLDGVLFSHSQNALICYPSNKAENSYQVPNNIKAIEANAFEYSKNLEAVFILGELESIADSAFEFCEKLKEIEIPTTVHTIADSAFRVTDLRTITIPASVHTIGYESFAHCNNLQSATFEGNVPSNFGRSVFNYASNNFTIYADINSAFTEPTWNDYKCILSDFSNLGWRELWFGMVYFDKSNWLYHPAFAWFYPAGEFTIESWFWTREFGWIFMKQSYHPWFYSSDDNDWYYMLEQTDGSYRFYSKSLAEWLVQS